jgi:hypothetical protein
MKKKIHAQLTAAAAVLEKEGKLYLGILEGVHVRI